MADPDQQPGRRFTRLAVVLAGIVLGQFLLYGPSLVGRKVLLPLNYLAFPNCYLADTLQTPNSYQDPTPQDLVLLFEPDRLFAIREFVAGRFPLWTPFKYGGVPFIWPKYSPFFLLACSGGITRHPRVGATPGRADCSHGSLFFLPACAPSEFLAGDTRRVVLSHDRLFYFLARLPHLCLGLLAALVAVHR